jgi:hypothetical protein
VKADERYRRWIDWMTRIEKATFSLFLHRYFWGELAAMTQAASLPPSSIFRAFGQWYAESQMAAVRRQVDRRQDTVSLWRLLDEIARYPEVMTRTRHVALWDADEDLQAQAHQSFDQFAGAGRERLDPASVRADRDRLRKEATIVVNHANEVIAHAAEKRTSQVPTYGEMNDAIDEIGSLVQKYRSLLKAASLSFLVPIIPDDWKAPFRRPWLVEEFGD